MNKFKNTEELEKAYKELEREFTKKSQKLALYEKTNYVSLLNKEMDSLVDDYAKRRISDLEAKLAELGQENRELHTSINLSIPNQIAMKDEIERLHTCIDKRISELVDENDNLKQQLAEKEKEIKQLKNGILFSQLQAPKEQILNILGSQCIQYNPNQDKISFAIAELEKVKKNIKKCNYKDFGIMYQSDAIKVIDNQIASLKKGVE